MAISHRMMLAAVAMLAAALACAAPVPATEPSGAAPEKPTGAPVSAPAAAPTEEPTAAVAAPAPAIGPETAADLQQVAQIDLAGETFTALAWSPDGGLLAVGTENAVLLVDPVSGQTTAALPVGAMVSTLAFSPDGHALAVALVGEPPMVRLLSVDPAAAVSYDAINGVLGGARAAAFSPDGSLIAAAFGDGTAIIFRIADARPLLTVDLADILIAEGLIAAGDPPPPIGAVAFSPDGFHLATDSGGMGVIAIWDAGTGQHMRTYTAMGIIAGPVASAQLSPTWATLIWVSRGSAFLIDAASGEIHQQLSHEDWVYGLDVTPDDRLIATSSLETVNGEFQPVLKLWDAASGAEVRLLTGFPSPPLVQFSPDSTLLAALDKGSLTLWGVGS